METIKHPSLGSSYGEPRDPIISVLPPRLLEKSSTNHVEGLAAKVGVILSCVLSALDDRLSLVKMEVSHIELLREKYGEAPRTLSIIDLLTTFRYFRPSWCSDEPADKINDLFDEWWDIYEEGEVVWARIVQANSQLYQKGKDDHPGLLVFSFERESSSHINELNSIADALYQLKASKSPNPDLEAIGDNLRDERARFFGLKVPHSISPKLDCIISCTFFVRKHFSGKVVTSNLLPVMACREKPNFVLPLPCKYWTDEFREWWLSQA